MRIDAGPPPRGQSSGRLARMAGTVGMLLGAAIIVETATGRAPIGKDHSIGYMAGGLMAAYGLFRYLRGRSVENPSRPASSRYER